MLKPYSFKKTCNLAMLFAEITRMLETTLISDTGSSPPSNRISLMSVSTERAPGVSLSKDLTCLRDSARFKRVLSVEMLNNSLCKNYLILLKINKNENQRA